MKDNIKFTILIMFIIFMSIILSGLVVYLFTNNRTILKSYTVDVILTRIDPPVYMKVDLHAVSTNYIYKNVQVAKHCSNYKNLKLGTKYSITFQIIHNKVIGTNTEWISHEFSRADLNRILCNK